jgi:hypothetical protein
MSIARPEEIRSLVIISMNRWCGAVAQLGARLDGIEEVVGSNPIGSTKKSIVRPGDIGNTLYRLHR